MLFQKPTTWFSAWLPALVWMVIVWLTIPFARPAAKWVSSTMGREAFTWFMLIMVGMGLVSTLYVLLKKFSYKPLSSYFYLAISASIFGYWTWELKKQSAEEALHFLQYGVLSLFFLRAWSYHHMNKAIYPLSLALVGLAGTADEWIQWLTPARYWGWRDIVLNLGSGALMALTFRLVFQPARLSHPIPRRALKPIYTLWTLLFLFWWVSLLNTPKRAEIWLPYLPDGEYLLRKIDLMSEYGHKIEDPDIGIFKSRFTPEQLAMLNTQRGVEAGNIIKENINMDYGEFLRTYSPATDPYVHEAKVHFKSRNILLKRRVPLREKDPEAYRKLTTRAVRENQILETYFPNMLTTVGKLNPAWVEEMKNEMDTNQIFYSNVSKNIYTAFTEKQARIGGALFIILFILVGYMHHKKAHENNP